MRTIVDREPADLCPFHWRRERADDGRIGTEREFLPCGDPRRRRGTSPGHSHCCSADRGRRRPTGKWESDRPVGPRRHRHSSPHPFGCGAPLKTCTSRAMSAAACSSARRWETPRLGSWSHVPDKTARVTIRTRAAMDHERHMPRSAISGGHDASNLQHPGQPEYRRKQTGEEIPRRIGLQHVANAMFANSRSKRARPTPQDLPQHISGRTRPARTGMLPLGRGDSAQSATAICARRSRGTSCSRRPVHRVRAKTSALSRWKTAHAGEKPRERFRGHLSQHFGSAVESSLKCAAPTAVGEPDLRAQALWVGRLYAGEGSTRVGRVSMGRSRSARVRRRPSMALETPCRRREIRSAAEVIDLRVGEPTRGDQRAGDNEADSSTVARGLATG